MKSVALALVVSTLLVPASLAAEFTANQLFVATKNGNSVIALEPTSAAPFYAPTGFTLTGQPPADVAFGPDGRAYASSGTAVRVFDPAGTLVDTITGAGLIGAAGLAFGPGGDLFVASNVNGLIIRYRNLGAGWQVANAFESTVSSPRGLAISPDGSLYVSDDANGKIVELDASGVFVRAFSTGSPDDEPRGLAFGPFGHLFVAMATSKSGEVTSHDRVFELISSGVKVNEYGAGSGLDHPHGVAFGPNGNLFVTSNATGEVFEFDRVTHAKVTQVGSLTLAEGLAFVPQRFKVVLNGKLAIEGEPTITRKEKGVLSIAPGSRTMMFAFTDVDNDGDGFFANFVQTAIVTHGFEWAQDDDAHQRVFGGAQVDNFLGGIGEISLTIKGHPDGFGDYQMKDATGSVGRHGASGGWNATIDIVKKLNPG